VIAVRKGAADESVTAGVRRQAWNVQRAAWLPGVADIALAGAGGYVALQNAESKVTIVRKVHPFAVTALGFSTDGEWLATASAGGDLRLFRRGEVHDLAVVRDRVYQLANATKLVAFLVLHRLRGDYAVRDFAIAVGAHPDRDAKRRDVDVVALTEAG